MWQRDRLSPPSTVTQATDEYFQEQDSIKAWVTERCERDPHNKMPSRVAFSDWKRWMTEKGEEARTEKWFSEGLQRHAAKRAERTGKVFIGLRLRSSETGAW